MNTNPSYAYRLAALALGIALASCASNDRSEPSPTPQPEGPVVVDRVLDYRPAPGQYTGQLPKWEVGDDAKAMNAKALSALRSGGKQLVSLGSFGGYIVLGLSRTLPSVKGKREFRLLGNAYYTDYNPNPNPPSLGGSAEPGVVCVAYDANKNGQPDTDEWYELAGSEYHKSTTIHSYSITYYRPKGDKPPVPGPEDYIIDAQYIRWIDNQGQSGYIQRNSYHTTNSYYPEWIEGDRLVLVGTRLRDNAVWEASSTDPKRSLWVLYAYDWGYADNHPNDVQGSTFDLDWCVDRTGRPVSLPGIDFIKIYTGIRQSVGPLGDSSTEVAGFVAL